MTTKPQPPSIYEPDAYVVIDTIKKRKLGPAHFDVVAFRGDWRSCQQYRQRVRLIGLDPRDFDIIPAEDAPPTLRYVW